MRGRALLAIYFLILSIFFLHQINSGDFFHHINTGRDIIQNFSLPYLDTWTFTANGKPWVAYSWGTGVVFYLVQTIFGYNGISVLFALIGGFTVFFLFLTLKNLKIPIPINLTLVFLASSIISLRFPTRPEVLGPFFVSLLLFLLTNFKNRIVLVCLPIIFWLWAILYGSSAFLGIAIFAVYLAATGQINYRNMLVFFFCLVLSMVNGYGLSSFLYIFQIPKIAVRVGEWLPLFDTINPNNPQVALFYQYPVLYYLLLTFLFLITLIMGLIKKRVIVFKNIFWLGLCVFVFAPFYSSRFINLAPLFISPIFALAITILGRKLRFILLGMILLLALAASFTRFYNFGIKTGLASIPYENKAIRFLKDKNISGNIFASQELGGFIYWELPDSKIFVDTRDDLYLKTAVFEDLELLAAGNMDIINLLDKYQATIVLGELGTISYQDLFYHPKWRLVFLSEGYFLSVRNELMKRHSLKPFNFIDPTKVPPTKSGYLEKALNELEDILTTDSSIENKIRLIEIKLAQKKPDQAKKILETLDFSDHNGAAQVILELSTLELKARVFLASGDCDKAYQVLNLANQKSQRQLIFSRNVRLLTSTNLYLGQYYLSCKKDRTRAKEYFLRYMEDTPSVVEKRHVEEKIKMLEN